ncbi:hypothetical protein BS17DRAFT_776919, partial [Gyrodon lividus]
MSAPMSSKSQIPKEGDGQVLSAAPPHLTLKLRSRSSSRDATMIPPSSTCTGMQRSVISVHNTRITELEERVDALRQQVDELQQEVHNAIAILRNLEAWMTWVFQLLHLFLTAFQLFCRDGYVHCSRRNDYYDRKLCLPSPCLSLPTCYEHSYITGFPACCGDIPWSVSAHNIWLV